MKSKLGWDGSTGRLVWIGWAKLAGLLCNEVNDEERGGKKNKRAKRTGLRGDGNVAKTFLMSWMIQNIKGKRVPLFFRQTEFLSLFLFLIFFSFFLFRVFKINHKRYTWIVKVIYLILCSKIFKNHRKQLYQRTVHKSFQKIMFLPSPCNDRPKTAAKSRSGNEPKIVIDEKKGGEIEKGKKEKKNLMDACTHDRGRASSAREGEGTTIRYPGNRCPGPVVA